MRAKARDFLLEQGRERSCPFVRSCDVHEGQLSELRKLAHLPALALAGRAGALRGVEPLPVAAEIGDIGTARMQMDIEVDKRIALLADAFGHFLQIDQNSRSVTSRHAEKNRSALTLSEKCSAMSGAL